MQDQLGLKACTQGYNALFKDAATLSTELYETKDNYHPGKLERTLSKADLLILDEPSCLSFNRHQSELLFRVISGQNEKSCTIVTTNLPFPKWTDLFENTVMVAALIDRLTFRSHVLDMNGDSYRLKATIIEQGASRVVQTFVSAVAHFLWLLMTQKFMTAWFTFSLTFTFIIGFRKDSL